MIEAVEKKEVKSVAKRYSIKEYFKLEEISLHKNEFLNGKIRQKLGGDINHNIILGAISALLFKSFFNTEGVADVYDSSVKIYIPDFNTITYTDTFVVKGKTEAYQGGKQAVLNPTLNVEVASKSTERYDRTTKFRMYKSLPSFKEYVIVNQDMRIVEVFHKIDEKQWRLAAVWLRLTEWSVSRLF